MAAIVLSTLNARYIHASLGLRYLRANLGPYRAQCDLKEFTTKRPPLEIANEILSLAPKVVGLGVYIWNTNQTLEVVRLLKSLCPDLVIVLGGPEISYETDGQELFACVDYVFQGEADFTFRDFIANWFEHGELPAGKIIAPALPEIGQLQFPYGEYSDEDIKNRTLYVEASRGCPYKCEYCLSALDVSVRSFNIDRFLAEMQTLLDRGVRQFKFVDRTFNLAPTVSLKILKFFLERIHLGLFLHFEMVPDRLGDELKAMIRQFPAGALQFEIGVQTWSREVARNVSRRQDYQKIADNFHFLRHETKVHTHADLIVGLPGETWQSFAEGFDALYALSPDEIQVGILKRLKGTPIIRHDAKFHMKYSTAAPFEILSNKDLTVEEVARLKVFAEFWDLVANSGRFPGIRGLVQSSPFDFFYELAQALYEVFARTHSIHLRDLEAAVRNYLMQKGIAYEVGAGRGHPLPHAVPERQVRHLQ